MFASDYGVPIWLRLYPSNLIRIMPAKGLVVHLPAVIPRWCWRFVVFKSFETMRKFFLLLLLSLSALAELQAQVLFSGLLTDAKTGLPLESAQCGFEGTSLSALTDSTGRFQLTLPQTGRFVFQCRLLGYFPLRKELLLRSNTELSFSLQPRESVSEEVIVSAIRSRPKDPGTFTNVDKAQIEALNLGQDLPVLLQNQTSVLSTSDAGAGVGYTGISIRGSDATRINVTINGIPVNDAESHGLFWVNMPDFASSVGSLQIQRGVGTSTNGSAAFGASLNLETDNVKSEAFAETNQSFGSFNTWKHNVRVGTGLLNNTWSAEARLSQIRSDGFIDRASSNLNSLYLSGSWFGKKSMAKLVVMDGREKTFQAWNGIPEARLRSDNQCMINYALRNGLSSSDSAHLFQSNPRTYNSFTFRDQTDNYRQTHYQLFYNLDLGKHWLLNTALHYTRGAGYYEEFKPGADFESYGLANPIIGNDTITNTNLIRQRWLDNHFFGSTYALQYENARLRFALGGSANRYMGDHFGYITWAQNSTLPDDRYRYYFNDGQKTDLSNYAKATFALLPNIWLYGDLQLRLVGYRFDGFDQNLNPTRQSVQFSFLNPKAGLTWQFHNLHQAYLTYGKSQREPVRDDFINSSPLSRPKAEILHNLELGWKAEGKTWKSALNFYGMWYPNQLILTGAINDVGAYIRSNVAGSSRLGLEWEGLWKFCSWSYASANLTLSRNRIREYRYFLDDYDQGGQKETVYKNTPIAFSPETIAAAEWGVTPRRNLEAAFIGKWVGRQFLDNTGSLNKSLDPYSFLHFRARYRLPISKVKDCHLQVLVNNLLNNRYETNGYTYGYILGGETVVENFYFPQAGRNFLVGLTLKL